MSGVLLAFPAVSQNKFIGVIPIAAFMDLVEATKHYPCVKKSWFEFMGEQPTEATAREE